MRVVFMGTPLFAVPSLEALHECYDVRLVLSRPAAVSGRGATPVQPPVAQRAAGLGLPLAQPETLRNADAVDLIASAEPDVICVAAYGLLLPSGVLAIPPLGCINVHASLLPRYRGAAPVERAILAGDEVAGVSIMRMEEGLDTGPFAATASVPIAGRYASEVIEELASLGARKLIDTLASIADGSAEWTPQQDAAATYAPKITKADVAIDSSLGRLEALARIRVSGLRTPVRIRIDDRLDVTVMRARLAETDVPPGFAVAEGGLLVIGFADGGLALERVTLAGKPPTSGEAWLRGARLHDQVTWGPVS